MTINEIDLTYVKEYLHAEDDDLRLLQHMASAKDLIMKANGFTDEVELESNEYLTDVYLIYVQQLYDTGKIEVNSAFSNLLTMDRRF